MHRPRDDGSRVDLNGATGDEKPAHRGAGSHPEIAGDDEDP